MAKPPRSHLLEELRAQANSLSARRAVQEQLSREVIERIDRRLHAVFEYFDEACKLLQIIAPQVEHEFTLPDIVHYTGMSFESGLVSFRKRPLQHRDVYDHVVVYYTLKGPSPVPLRLAARRSAEVERALRGANIEFTSDTDTAAGSAATRCVIQIAAGLRCEARFDPDFVNDSIVVTLRNVDRLESVFLDFPPAALDAAALDDLVNLMLGRSRQFLLRAPLRGLGR